MATDNCRTEMSSRELRILPAHTLPHIFINILSLLVEFMQVMMILEIYTLLFGINTKLIWSFQTVLSIVLVRLVESFGTIPDDKTLFQAH
jgi:hypothetical protein